MTFYFLPICRICGERHRINECGGAQPKPKFDRRTYQRNYMRNKRARERVERVERGEPPGNSRRGGEQLSLLTLFDQLLLEQSHVA